MSSKISRRAQRGAYKPVSEFKPNKKLPENASVMDKAKAKAKEDDLKSKSAVLKGMKEGEKKDEKPDFLDVDGDGDKKESMKKAAQDKK